MSFSPPPVEITLRNMRDTIMVKHDRNHELCGGKSEKMTMRLRHAHAIKRILDRKTLKIVGWLYEWNTGQIAPMWKDKPCKDVIYD